ncbi:NC domain protein [compost metagenome]
MSFFKNLKYLFEGIHDANKELVQGVRSDLKEFKTEMKDLTKQHYPVFGEAIERVDRVSQTARNFIEANNPIKAFSREFRHEAEPELGDHLVVQRLGYLHHGIYVGNERVIHFSDGYIKKGRIDEFKGVSTLNIEPTVLTYSPETAVLRACSKLGLSSYNVFSNNCEHFVNWCRNGGKYTDSI